MNHEKPELINDRPSKKARIDALVLEKHQQLLYVVFYDSVYLPKELIHLILSFHQPLLDRIIKTRKIKTDRYIRGLVCYEKEMYVSGISGVNVMKQDGTYIRSFEMKYSSYINVVNDKIYRIETNDTYETCVFDRNGKYLEKFGRHGFNRLIQINDHRFVAVCMEGRLYILDEKGDVLNVTKKHTFYGLVRHNHVNYAYNRYGVKMYDDDLKEIGSIDTSRHSQHFLWTFNVVILHNMIFINGWDAIKNGIHVFHMDGTFMYFYETDQSSSIEVVNNEIWIALEGHTDIMVLECLYK